MHRRNELPINSAGRSYPDGHAQSQAMDRMARGTVAPLTLANWWFESRRCG